MKMIQSLATLTTLGIFTLAAAGCGGSPEYEGAEQQSTANQQAARSAAYGNANNPAKAKKGRSALSPEAQARGRSGH